MEFIENLKAQMAADGFHFDPAFHEGPKKWHKIKKPHAPIGGAYACRLFDNGAMVTYVSWNKELKKTWEAFSNGYMNGESGEIKETEKFLFEEADKAKTEANAKAAIEADTLWLSSSDILPEFAPPYLTTKHLSGALGVRTDPTTTKVFIRMRDIENKTWGIQTIFANGEKRFAKGQRKESCFHLIGEIREGETLYIAEGFATGASIHLGTGKAVVVAFDAGNLKRCAAAIRGKFPKTTIIIAGDNDETQTGQKAAEAAAKEVGGYAFYPSTIGKDWNDCHVEKGLEFLKETFRLFEKELSKQAPKSKFNDAFNVVKASERRHLVVREPDWIVDALFAKGSISLLAADPKAGKSTFTRFLAKCVLDGDNFLGFKCKQSRVLMIAVEEKERFIINNMEKDKLNLQNWEDFYYHVALTPTKAIEKAEEEILKIKPDIIIFDTMFKIVQPEDENSYAQTTKAIAQIQNLATWHNVHILSVHHNNKGGAVGFNKILGSNGIRGAFDYNIVLDTDAKEMENDPSSAARFIMSEGREGYFFKKTALNFNVTDKTFGLGQSFLAHKHTKDEQSTIASMSRIKSALTKTQWMAQMIGMGQKQDRMPFFEKLVEGKYLIEVDPSKRNSPWKWNRELIRPDAKF